jgi:chemotaxis protein CheD
MEKITTVLTGEVKVTKDNTILKSTAIGSCIIIISYDKKKCIGAMAHIMLPGVSPEDSPFIKTRYASNAIKDMLNNMIKLGTDREGIEVCIAGGANVLKKKDDTICQANINSVINILHKKNIKIKTKSLGGTQRRNISLNTENGIAYHSIGDGVSKFYYDFKNNE